MTDTLETGAITSQATMVFSPTDRLLWLVDVDEAGAWRLLRIEPVTGALSSHALSSLETASDVWLRLDNDGDLVMGVNFEEGFRVVRLSVDGLFSGEPALLVDGFMEGEGRLVGPPMIYEGKAHLLVAAGAELLEQRSLSLSDATHDWPSLESDLNE